MRDKGYRKVYDSYLCAISKEYSHRDRERS